MGAFDWAEGLGDAIGGVVGVDHLGRKGMDVASELESQITGDESRADIRARNETYGQAQAAGNAARDGIYGEQSGLQGQVRGGVDPISVRDFENFDGMRHAAMRAAADTMNEGSIRDSATTWRHLGDQVEGHFIEFMNTVGNTISEGWEGDAAAAASTTSSRYATHGASLGSAFTLSATKMEEAATGAGQTNLMVPPVVEFNPRQAAVTAVLLTLSGQGGPADAVQQQSDAAETARLQAVRVMTSVYVPVYAQADTGVPTFATPSSAVNPHLLATPHPVVPVAPTPLPHDEVSRPRGGPVTAGDGNTPWSRGDHGPDVGEYTAPGTAAPGTAAPGTAAAGTAAQGTGDGYVSAAPAASVGSAGYSAPGYGAGGYGGGAGGHGAGGTSAGGYGPAGHGTAGSGAGGAGGSVGPGAGGYGSGGGVGAGAGAGAGTSRVGRGGGGYGGGVGSRFGESGAGAGAGAGSAGGRGVGAGALGAGGSTGAGGSGAGAGSSAGTGTGTGGAGRSGTSGMAAGMGGMGAGRGGRGEQDNEHNTPSYLITEEHGSEIVGVLPAVAPAVIGE